MQKSVLLLPSVQRNEGLEGYVEGEGMRIIAELAHDLLLELPEYEPELFWPGYEQGASAVKLRRQHEQAELWLRARPGSAAQKLVLHLSSGTGAQSRVLGVYTPSGYGESRALATSVAGGVRRAMRVRETRIVSLAELPDSGLEAAPLEQLCTSALVVCGSHRNRRDVRILSETPEVVAAGVVEGILGFFRARAVGARPGVVWRSGRLEVGGPGIISRTAPSRTGRTLRAIGPAVLVTDGYTEGGQRVAGSTRWYHLARECGYGWVHSSAGRYIETDRDSQGQG